MTLAQMLRSGTSYDWAVRYLHEGRITQRTFDWYCLLWDWAAPRFSGSAGYKQERFYEKMGQVAYDRRIARVKRLYDRIKAQ